MRVGRVSSVATGSLHCGHVMRAIPLIIMHGLGIEVLLLLLLLWLRGARGGHGLAEDVAGQEEVEARARRKRCVVRV